MTRGEVAQMFCNLLLNKDVTATKSFPDVPDTMWCSKVVNTLASLFTLTVTSGSKTVTDFGGSVKVSLPYTLKDGESAEDVTVWYLASDGTMTEIPCTYDAKTGLATFTVTHFSQYVVGVDTSWVNPFTDVKESDWCYDAVKYANEAGLFSGVSTTSFAPNEPMTRAMLWTVLARQAGQDTTGGSVWYEKAQAWVAEKGISDGVSIPPEIAHLDR